MRILIDLQGAQGLSYDRGIGRYSRSFLKAFIENRSDHEVYILMNANFPDSIEAVKRDYKDILPEHHIILFHTATPTNALNPENEWRTKSSELLREKFIEDIAPDFLIITSLFEGTNDHSISSIGRYTNKIPTAVIFYDLIPYIHPEKFLIDQNTENWYLRKVKSLKQANVLLCISESARGEAVDYLQFPEERTVNISSAADTSFTMGGRNDNIRKKYHIDRPFLMHTSAYEERKNFEGLIKAFSILPDLLRKAYQLVLVCKLKPEQKNFLEKVIKKSGLARDEVILTGFVSDEDLVSLYSECHLFVFPSLHEGFGLPLLEAMSCGAAVIGSNSSSIPEVIGYSDALFDPRSPKSIAHKIEEVLTSSDLWSILKKHAQLQAKKFSWDNTALRAIKFLETMHQDTPLLHNTRDIRWSNLLLFDKIDDMGCTQIPSEGDLKQTAIALDENEKTLYKLLTYLDYGKNLKWRIEGPFDSSYSLALVNREIAAALTLLGHDIALHSTDGPGDFEPNPVFINQHPDIEILHKNRYSISEDKADVTSRNLYPPRVSDMHSSINMLHNYAWEESAFPQEWIAHFNSSLQGIVTTSNYVKKILIDNGVTVPLFVSGNGVDHWERISPDKTYVLSAKAFRFLHVSSCFPRKGADILLKAYSLAFSSKDDVTLVIKTFTNPHNKVRQWLNEAKKKNPDFPSVLIIEEDLSDEKLKALYQECHALVGPSRAEGFGLPFAEAMLSGLPVITTGWGGQLDFCNNETAWLIDYDFTLAQTHFELFDSVWAEPSVEHLASLMHEIHALPLAQRLERSKKGRRILLNHFTWRDAAERLVSASRATKSSKHTYAPKIGWISSWNTKCGIASYSQHLINALQEDVAMLALRTDHLISADDSNVYRCWDAGDDKSLDALTQTIEELKLNTLVIQFNYSFFDFKQFSLFLEEQHTLGRTIVLMLHSTTDSESTPHKKLKILTPAFHLVDRLLVHTPDDLNRLKSYGLVDNVALFSHGILDWEQKEENTDTSFILATYGFFLPHKGLKEIIESVKILVNKGLDLKLKMINAEYPVPLSADLVSSAREYIEALGLSGQIELINDFLPDEVSLNYLGSADLLVFPYQETGESSSASVRYGLATGKPVAVTPLKIFSDVLQAVYVLPGSTPREMAEGIEKLIVEIKEDSQKAREKKSAAQKWCNAHRYSVLGEKLGRIVRAVKQGRI